MRIRGLKKLFRASNVASAEQTVKELDIPQASDSGRDIEVTVYVLGATNKPQSAVTTPTATPKPLEAVVKQLQSIFPMRVMSYWTACWSIPERVGKPRVRAG